MYSDADIILIDDCLSALDAAVANAIFTDLICEYLKTKTIVFVTHALHFIEKIEKSNSSFIRFLFREGKSKEKRIFNQLRMDAFV